METSSKNIKAASTDVAYPSKKPPVHPVKLETRKAMLRLNDAGVTVRQNGKGFPGVFSLVKHAPEILDEIIEAASSGSTEMKVVWGSLLSRYYTPLDNESTHYIFKTDLQVARLAAARMRPGSKYSGEAIRNVTSVIRQFRDVDPGIKEFEPLVNGYELYAEIIGRTTKFVDRRQKFVTTANYDRIKFISENLEAIRAIAPELKKRRTTDPGIISEMIKHESTPLLNGVL